MREMFQKVFAGFICSLVLAGIIYYNLDNMLHGHKRDYLMRQEYLKEAALDALYRHAYELTKGLLLTERERINISNQICDIYREERKSELFERHFEGVRALVLSLYDDLKEERRKVDPGSAKIHNPNIDLYN